MEKQQRFAGPPSERLKAKLQQFADLYRGGPDEVRNNATKCYQVVHPKCQTAGARKRANGYLHHPYTLQLLKEAGERTSEAADVTQERVLREVGRLALFDPRKLFDSEGRPLPIQDLDDDTAACISGVKVTTVGNSESGLGEIREYKINDKNAALEKLMKYLGAYEIDNKQKHASLADALMAGIERTKQLD